jgi:hypothetical protein
MSAVARRSRRSLLVLGAVASLAFSACSGNAATPTPAPTPVATPTPEVTDNPTPSPTQVSGCDLAASATALAGLDSYQFKMVLAGSAADAPLADLFLDQADTYTLTGTIVNNPASAADIKIGTFHVIEVGGTDYQDADGSGTFTQLGGDQGSGDSGGSGDTSAPTDTPSPSSTPGLAAQFSPLSIYQTTVASAATSGYSQVGTENKNGVDAIHCQASATSLEAYGSMLGVTDATWSSDVWIATSGGYPVSVALVAKAKSGSVVYEVLIDLSKVNDPTNSVVAPTNIGGA